MSLSARRAWIEMTCGDGRNEQPRVVALRKESVDRNIQSSAVIVKMSIVALRKESVDRNAC